MVDCTCIDKTWCSNATEDPYALDARSRERDGLSMILSLQGDVWYGEHYEHGEPDPYIVCLFGSHLIPLPYTRYASAAEIDEYVIQLRKQFPNHEVSRAAKGNSH